MSTLVIAEAGVNHNGDLERARDMVRAAAEAGADIVKFQTFDASKLLTDAAPKAAYQLAHTDAGESQLDMVRMLQLSADDHHVLVDTCREHGIRFLSTAFDLDSLDFLNRLGIDRVKVPSGEITNLPYLRRIAQLGKPVLLSTGMANLGEIEAAVEVLESNGADRSQITILQCTTEYPAPDAEVNLRAMVMLRSAFRTPVGYSDHSTGIEIPLAAVALGAVVIEKHFTLNRTLPGPDHQASLEPSELAKMVKGIRRVEVALGDGIKRPSASERRNLPIARRSIVAATHIRAGEPFTESNLTTKRPGTGLSPMRWDLLLGRLATRDYVPDDLIDA